MTVLLQLQKLFIVFATLTVASSAFPQHSQYGRPYASALTTSLDPVIPEGCTFISSKKEVGLDGTITGEYSYQDPVGSTIIVNYSVNGDGTNYTESRKVIKGYETDQIKGTI